MEWIVRIKTVNIQDSQTGEPSPVKFPITDDFTNAWMLLITSHSRL